MLERVLGQCGGRRTDEDDWDVYWARGEVPDEILRRVDAGRRLSAYLAQGWLCTKHGLATALERARQLAQRRVAHDLFDFAPRSFVFPADFHAWRVRAEDEPDTIWISKVGTMDRGEGVNMVTDVNAVRPDPELVLQEYLATPHLLDGFKYSLRVYVAFTSLEPLRVWVFPDGLTKLTTRPFTLDRASLGDRFVHLTNRAVLRSDEAEDLSSKFMTHEQYRARLRRDGHDDAALFRAIHAMVAKTALAVREVWLKAQGEAGVPDEACFTLVGLDVIVDRAMRPWLIEVNENPSLAGQYQGASETARAEAAIKARVVTDLFTLLGLGTGPAPAYEPIFPSPSMFEWLPAYEEVRPDDVADLRAICATTGLDPRVDVDAVTVERDAPDELVVVHERNDHRFELNATAALIWRSFARGLSAGETVRAVEAQDGPETAIDDVWETLAQFVQLGVWTVRTSAAP